VNLWRWHRWPWRAGNGPPPGHTAKVEAPAGAWGRARDPASTAWDPAALDRLRRIHLVARVASRTLWLGHQRSRRTGDGQVFAAHVDYGPDHDARRIDWRAWGRNDRLVVKRFDTETRVPVWLIVDLSADASTGAARADGSAGALETKADRLVTLAATLALWVQRQGEPVGLMVLGGDGVDVAVRTPRNGPSHVAAVIATLARAKPAGRADLAEGLASLARRRPGRSVVFVLSDAMEPVASFAPALGSLAALGADLRWLQVADEAELALDLPAGLLLYSPEDGAELPVDPRVASEAFRAEVARWRDEVRRSVTAVGGAHLYLPVQEPIERAVLRIAKDDVGGAVSAGRSR